MSKIYSKIEGCSRISIIGMDKNVGKTTLLNKIIDEVKERKILGITSIGRDGEEQDLVTNTPKPRIYIYKGTIIATAKHSLNRCDITKEILAVTEYATPMGNIVIARAKSDGYVDIAGPSFNEQLLKVIEIMEGFGSELTVIDGALSRKGSAAPEICQGTILATGAALSTNINRVVEETVNTVSSLTTLQYLGEDKEFIKDKLKENRVVIIYEDGKIETTEEPIFLETSNEMKKYLKGKISKLIVRGAITDKGIELLIKNRDCYNELTLISVDGTRFFISPINMKKAALSNIKFRVLDKVNLLFVTCNPISPKGYDFCPDKFKSSLKERLECEVINVMEE